MPPNHASRVRAKFIDIYNNVFLCQNFFFDFTCIFQILQFADYILTQLTWFHTVPRTGSMVPDSKSHQADKARGLFEVASICLFAQCGTAGTRLAFPAFNVELNAGKGAQMKISDNFNISRISKKSADFAKCLIMKTNKKRLQIHASA